MNAATFPEFVTLRTIKQLYGISPNALSQRKARGEALPFPLYNVVGIKGLAVRYSEAKAYFDNLAPADDFKK
jgi:hypothetical protein